MKKIDIRKKDKKISFKYLWLMDQFEKLRASAELVAFTDKEIFEYLSKKYEERKILNGRLYNNADNKNKVLTQEQFINMYLNESFILSGYSCFYQNQDNSINISSAALENLGSSRKKYKKMMEAAEHGSDDYIYYRILQLTFKVLMNSYFSCDLV